MGSKKIEIMLSEHPKICLTVSLLAGGLVGNKGVRVYVCIYIYTVRNMELGKIVYRGFIGIIIPSSLLRTSKYRWSVYLFGRYGL